MVLSEFQMKAMEWLSRPQSGHTCTIVGSMLTQRKSSFGHQTSAREGGRTLRSLQRRGLVTYFDLDGGLRRSWVLTPKGVAELEAIRKG
jgi:hypothetical protein